MSEENAHVNPKLNVAALFDGENFLRESEKSQGKWFISSILLHNSCFIH